MSGTAYFIRTVEDAWEGWDSRLYQIDPSHTYKHPPTYPMPTTTSDYIVVRTTKPPRPPESLVQLVDDNGGVIVASPLCTIPGDNDQVKTLEKFGYQLSETPPPEPITEAPLETVLREHVDRVNAQLDHILARVTNLENLRRDDRLRAGD